MESRIVFPNYLQMKRLLPIPAWHVVRVLSVGITLGVCIILLIRPAVGLTLLWGLIVPTLPLVFFLAPGFWRNACPLAAMNQTPRLFGLTQGFEAPKWFKEYGYVISIALFMVIVSSRKIIFNSNGPVLALLIILILGTAFVMGVFFKGKSGWCSSVCPLLPVQRVYGQTPFVKIPNSHCQPCVGCTKNCYDFNPHVAYLADLYDKDRYFGNYRKFFVGLFPGFILAFYTLPNPPEISALAMYGWFALYSLISAGTFFLLESFIKVTPNKITVLYGAAALNLYYWFSAPILARLLSEPFASILSWSLRLFVFGATLFWIYRTYRKETQFVELSLAPAPVKVGSQNSLVSYQSAQMDNPEVTFQPDNKRIVVKPGRTLLEVAENNNLEIEPGCRMGVCGADPVCILKGMENLSKMSGDERTTVERLSLGDNIRMACMARVKGPVTVSLKPEAPQQFKSSIVQGFKYDRAVQKVVIIGNGIAGVTAADHVRRNNPECDIDLIGQEPHNLYNRMGITRLIYGRTAMQGLYLMPDKWYSDLGITTWLNTQVNKVDPQSQEVFLGTGDVLAYDRLILTTGSEGFIPPIEGYGLPGTFALRTAEDAINIRSFVQHYGCKQAVIAGGGLLGLEAGYALHKLGLKVSVLERSEALLRRQLDARGGEFLRDYLDGLGMSIVTKAETASVQGTADQGTGGRIKQVRLKDGRTLPCDILLVCVGIRSELNLARQIGLEVNRGIIVDDQMRTSIPHIFAAGDVAEVNGQIYGLWPVAVSQGEVAAVNAVGGNRRYEPVVPVTMLKVVGIDLTSIGQIQAQANDESELVLEDLSNHRYRKLVIAAGKIVGAILIGYPQVAPGVAEAVKGQVDMTPHLEALRAGDWQTLVDLTE